MDPNEAVRSILRRLWREDDSPEEREELSWLLSGLAEWIDKGGFFPDSRKALEDFISELEKSRSLVLPFERR